MSDPAALIYGDTERSAALRHELPIAIGDPFLYLEAAGKRVAITNVLEVDRLAVAAPDVELILYEDLGIDELLAAGTHRTIAEWEICQRACERLDIRRAIVPDEFPVALADHLRSAGIELQPDGDAFEARRRVKNAAELAGIRRAQKAAEAGMAAVAAALREAKQTTPGEELTGANGETLTAENVRARLREACANAGAPAPPDVIVAPGAQGSSGHESGHGPLHAGEPIVVDLWPRDERTGCNADMTRTFVVGPVPEATAKAHAVSMEALQKSLEVLKPGEQARRSWEIACAVFEQHGYPTQRTKQPGERLTWGFYFSLGHGVGLEVHEFPTLGRSAGAATVLEGEVYAVEPGTCDENMLGARVEDLVLVTKDGNENLTDYAYDLAP